MHDAVWMALIGDLLESRSTGSCAGRGVTRRISRFGNPQWDVLNRKVEMPFRFECSTEVLDVV